MNPIGDIIVFLGSVLAIFGAIYNCLSYHRVAGAIWFFSNTMLGVTFFAVYMGWIEITTSYLAMVLMYLVFTTTSLMLWKNNCATKKENSSEALSLLKAHCEWLKEVSPNQLFDYRAICDMVADAEKKANGDD